VFDPTIEDDSISQYIVTLASKGQDKKKLTTNLQSILVSCSGSYRRQGYSTPWHTSGGWVPSLLQPQCMLLSNLGHLSIRPGMMPLWQQNVSAHFSAVDPCQRVHQGSTTLQCGICTEGICTEVYDGYPGYSTACTEVVTEMAAGALRFAKGAEGPWGACFQSINLYCCCPDLCMTLHSMLVSST
jgi:hypothetical protein